ncbi:hypothetical protein [Gracilimonas sp. BCB1]|uniref:hypothetical protein n=1 Tax=Gracilimonas sp. BCB1 TaxID=3152362 RepID=UPI0032D8E02F
MDEQKLGPTGEVYKVENKPGCLIAEMHPSKNKSEKIELSFDQDIYSDLKYHQKNTFSSFIESNDDRSLLIILKHRIDQLKDSLGRISNQDYYSHFPNYLRVLKNLHHLLLRAYEERKSSAPKDINFSHVNDKVIPKTKQLTGASLKNRKAYEKRYAEVWPKVVRAVNDIIGVEPLNNFLKKNGKAKPILYNNVLKKVPDLSKSTAIRWLNNGIESGDLESDLKKITTD